MKIGKLEVSLSLKWGNDHPDSWGKFKVKRMVEKILMEFDDGKTSIAYHKIGYIKALRRLTEEHCNTDDKTKPRWGLLEQKLWVERNMVK